jgi:heptosyltransferase-1
MKIAIVKLSALGDITHAMIVLQYIKNNNKEVLIDWIVEQNYKELLEFNPDINETHVINLKTAKKKKSLSLFFADLQRLRKLGPYDLVIDMQGLIKSAFLSKIIPSKSTLGFDRNSVREPFASFFYSEVFNIGYEENIIKRNFELLKFALKLPSTIEDLQSKLPFIFSSQKYENSDLSNTKRNVVIVSGASHASKLYPVSKIAKLTKSLDANIIIIWGNRNEKILADEIKTISPRVNVSGKLSLDALISLLTQVDLVIGSDTGPTHLAWALNIPSITLFGATPGYRNTLASDKNQVIESKSKVNPFKINKKDYSIKDIKVEKVLQVANSLLAK